MTATWQATEQFAYVGRGVTLCFEELGDKDAPAMLLIAGFGQQLISWPTALCEALVERGFRVVRFDNRDSGRSTHLPGEPPGLVRMVTGRFRSDCYGLQDMGRDTVGLLDALGIDRAHLFGASMGGMIAQTVASRWPDRTLSLTSMFSTTGARGVGRPALSTWLKMAARPPRNADEAAAADRAMFAHIGSSGYEPDVDAIEQQARAAWARDPSADGAGRQLGAILASGDRTDEVRRISAPTLVIHGDRDRMVSTSGGRATHRAIAGSTLWIVPGLGHDYPSALWQTIADRVADHAHAAGTTPRDA